MTLLKSQCHCCGLVVFLLMLDALAGANKSCQITILYSCGRNESCVQASHDSNIGFCQCLPGFKRMTGACILLPKPIDPSPSPVETTTVPPSVEPSHHSSSKNAVVAGVLVPLALLATAVAGLAYVGQRCNWMQRLQQLRQSRTNDVLIGQSDDDDDPIA